MLQLLEPTCLNLLPTDTAVTALSRNYDNSFLKQTQNPAREEGRRESTGSAGRLFQSSPATPSGGGRQGPSVPGQDAARGLGRTRMDEVRNALDTLAAGPRR